MKEGLQGAGAPHGVEVEAGHRGVAQELHEADVLLTAVAEEDVDLPQLAAHGLNQEQRGGDPPGCHLVREDQAGEDHDRASVPQGPSVMPGAAGRPQRRSGAHCLGS